jgi:hypothetical protein
LRNAADIERDEKLAVTHAAFGSDRRAGAGCKAHVRRPRFTPLGHAIRVSGENRAAESDLCHCGVRNAECGRRIRNRIRNPQSEIRNDVRHALDVGRHVPPLIERREEIGGRRRSARGQHVSLGEQRARLGDLARAAGGDQHPREARVERQAAHLFAERREANRIIAGCGLLVADAGDEAEALEQRQCGVDGVVARCFEPLEGAWIAAPRDHVEDGARQINAVNLRLAMWSQSVARVPQPPDDARPEPSRAARSLIRGVRGDAFGLEAVDTPVGVVSRHLVQPRVDDGRHTGNRQRRLRDVGGGDHAAP